MKRKMIIYISIFGFLTTIILSNIFSDPSKEIQNTEEAVNLFVYVAADW